MPENINNIFRLFPQSPGSVVKDWDRIQRTIWEKSIRGQLGNADLWDARQAQGRGLVTKPEKLSSLGIKRLMERAIWLKV